MSQRPVAPHPDTSGHGHNTTLPPVKVDSERGNGGNSTQQTQAAGAHVSSQLAQRIQTSPQPSLQSIQSADDWSAPLLLRNSGVYSILNPEPELLRQSPQTCEADAPQPGSERHVDNSRPSSRDQRTLYSPQQHRQERAEPQPKGRKMPFPKSPRSLSQSAASGVFLQSTKQSAPDPYGARTNTATPGLYPAVSIPPLSSLPPQTQHGLLQTPPPLDRRRSAGAGPLVPSRLPLSQSASPNTLYSLTYSAQPSPLQMVSAAPESLSHGYFPRMAHEDSSRGLSSSQGYQQPEGPYINSLQPGGNVTQIGGPLNEFRVPVDTVSGSKVADHKRKHNAAASARFRKRRKEKEQQDAENNKKLEKENKDLKDELSATQQKLKEIEQELNYYRDAYTHDRGRGNGLKPSQGLSYATSLPLPPIHQRPEPEHQQEGRATRRRRTEGQESFNLPSAPTSYSTPRQTYAPSHLGMLPQLRMDVPNAQQLTNAAPPMNTSFAINRPQYGQQFFRPAAHGFDHGYQGSMPTTSSSSYSNPAPGDHSAQQ